MAKQSHPLDKPTRRTIEMLLREILNQPYSMRAKDRDYIEYEANLEKAEAMLEAVRNTPAYKKVKSAADRAYTRYWAKRRKQEATAKELRQHYLANGITPHLIAGLNTLIKVK